MLQINWDSDLLCFTLGGVGWWGFLVIELLNWRRNLHLGAGGGWSFKLSHNKDHCCMNVKCGLVIWFKGAY